MRGAQTVYHYSKDLTNPIAICGKANSSFNYGSTPTDPQSCCKTCLKLRGGVL